MPAGTAVQAAHGADVIIAEKAQDKVALPQQVAALLLRQFRVFLNGCQQQLFQLQHLRDLPPCEHPPHQDQNSKGIGFQCLGGAFVYGVQHILRLQRSQQNACITANDPQQRMVVLTFSVGSNSVKILSLVFIPLPETLPIELLRFHLHLVKAPFGTFLHHVMKAIGHAIRQTRDKGVLLGQHGEDLRRIRIPCDILRHFDGKLIGKAHYRQKLPLPFRQRINHSGGKSSVDVGISAGQHAALGEGTQIQIHGREPALAGIEKAFHLRIGKVCPAAVGINCKLRMVEAQLFHADLIYLAPQPHRFRSGQKAVTACNDHMHICRQPICQHAKEQRCALVRQQMKIVNKDITGGIRPPAYGRGRPPAARRLPRPLGRDTRAGR